MKNKRKLVADTAQKLGLGFTIATFLQADTRTEGAIFAILAIFSFVIAFIFTDEDE